MDIETYTRRTYDQHGCAYHQSRLSHDRVCNEFLEVPCMLKAVGPVKGKRLLDLGCGSGLHIKLYSKRGAICSGIDISSTMVAIAKKECPKADFKIGTIRKLPYASSSFDIVTASLSVHYLDDLKPVFKEASRVLKKGGLFIYSTGSVFEAAREKYEDADLKLAGIGRFIDKRRGKTIYLGKPWKEDILEWEMIPGMMMKTYHKTFRTQLRALVASGLELIDFIDCKPIPAFEKLDPADYEYYTYLPLFSIFKARKK